MGVRLRYLSHDLEMPTGQFVVGRSTDCQLSLDDGLVSRRHALLTVGDGTTTIEDLGSRNGVLVNGVKITGALALDDGDEITIGSQKMTIHGVKAPTERLATPSTRRNRMADTIMNVDDLREDQDDKTRMGSLDRDAQNPDKRVHPLSLVGSVADKALALGRAEDAERLLEKPLLAMLDRAEAGELAPEVADPAGRYALKLASETKGGKWIDYLFRLYTAQAMLLPKDMVDELYEVVRNVRTNRSYLQSYLEMLDGKSRAFSPAERFLLKRIQGLEPLAALK